MAERTLVDHLLEAAGRWPDRPAWTFDPGTGPAQTLRFRDLDRRSAAYAQALRERGVRAGDRVAVMLDNRAEFPLVWLALMRLGAAMVPLNVRYRSADAGHVLADSGAVLALTSPAYADLLGPVADVVLIDDLVPAGDWQQGPLDPATTVNVQYTSGTTGLPKGCVLTHRYWTTLGTSMLREFPYVVADDVMLSAQPFFYLDPQWNVVTALMAGAHLVVLDGFHPSTFWAKVREHQVTYFYCLAAMPTLLLKMPRRPARPRPPGPGGAVLRDPAGPARRARAALGRAVVRGVRDDRDRRGHPGLPRRPR